MEYLGQPGTKNCSLRISDVRQSDSGTYVFYLITSHPTQKMPEQSGIQLLVAGGKFSFTTNTATGHTQQAHHHHHNKLSSLAMHYQHNNQSIILSCKILKKIETKLKCEMATTTSDRTRIKCGTISVVGSNNCT